MSEVFGQLAAGSLNLVTVVIWTCLAFVLAAGAGALAAVKIAGKDLGNELAAAMGAMFGPTAAVPGIVVGLIILKFI